MKLPEVVGSDPWSTRRLNRAVAPRRLEPGGQGFHDTRQRSGIERLPKWLLCVPLVAQWFWLGARYGSLTLPSVLNPAIENGGLAGESKLACLACIGPQHSRWVARTQAVRPGEDADARRQLAGLDFPLIAKPDIGWCGYGVQRVDDATQLAAYADVFPADATYLLQEYVSGPGEAGLFYSRDPGAAAGRLIAIALRHQPQVIGDGLRTVRELAADDLRLTGRAIAEALADVVPAPAEVVLLTTVASLRVGGRYEDARRLICPALETAVDAIARSMGGFNFGRFDVRFGNEDDLRAGVFRLIEVNGAGSEAIHFWDPSFTLMQAFSGVWAKQSLLFALASGWRAQGARSVGVLGLARAWLRQQKLIKRYPSSN